MRQQPEARWWLVSVLAHAVAIMVLVWAVGNPGMFPWLAREAVLRSDTVTIVWPEARERGAGSGERVAVVPALGPLPPAAAPSRPLALRDTLTVGLDLGLPTGDAMPPVSLTPGFGDGRLWVRPGAVARGRVGAEAPIGGVSAPLDPERHAERIDSVLAARILAYLDTLPPDSFAVNLRPPSWTTEINGRTWGVDQQWIYLGDFRLPTMLLGLLPLGGQGNYEQGQRAAELQRMREDILRAAARASDAADFRRYVNELRERREAERRDRVNP
jgi:hypothetical protein